MSNHHDDDLEPALRAMLGDHHLDVHPRSDAIGTVLAGVGRARRRRTTGYAAIATLAVAGVIGAVTLTGPDSDQGFQPVVPPGTTESPSTSPTPAPTTPPSSGPSTPPPSSPPPIVEDTAPPLQQLAPDGIGDVKLGMSPADAYGTDTLGMLDLGTGAVIPWDGSAAETACTPAGQAKRSTPDGAIVWMDESRGVGEIAIWQSYSDPEVQTVEGLRLHDDLDRVLELYPDARRDDVNPSTTRYFVDNWGGSGNVLTIRDYNTGTVFAISVASPGGGGGCYE